MAAAAKIAIIASAVAGVLLQAWLGAHEWPPLLPLTIGALIAGFSLVWFFPIAGWAPVLVTACVYPAIFHATRGHFPPSCYAILFAGLLGGIIAAAPALRWHLPSPWRLPLTFWGLVLALGWPVSAFREMNFFWSSLMGETLANSGLGGPPPVIIVTILVAVLPQILGILWFDALFGQFAHQDAEKFRRAILFPLGLGLVLGSALAIYQWTFDVTFLSAHQWPFYQRAAGGLLDGNAFGALAGVASAAALSWAVVSGRVGMVTGLAITLVLWLGLWATGSRMALLAGLFGLAAAAIAAVRGGRGRMSLRAVMAAVAGVALTAVALGVSGRWGMDPVSRTIVSLPQPTRESLAAFIEFEFWNRFGPFGTASVKMVRDSPLVGTGPGTFEVLYTDYAYVVTNGATRSHFDNAQSWYRHQLAELGLLGSLGWILWGAVFATFVWRAAPTRNGITEATGVKAAIVGLALISIVSMPTRNAVVSLLFWVFAFWLVKLSSQEPGPRWLGALTDRKLAWALVWVLALGFAAGTAWVGYTRLRPPHRALMAEWDYLNGVSRSVETPEGIRRYTDERGIAVFYAVPGAFLKLGFQVAHLEADRVPVRVRIFQGDTHIAHFVIGDRLWHELYIKVPEGEPDRMMLQMTVDRPAFSTATPARGLILKDWEFVGEPPPGATVALTPAAARERNW